MIMLEGNTTVQADWEEKQYTINYDANVPSGASKQGNMVAHSVRWSDRSIASVKDCGYSISGYSFVGWYTNKNGTGDPVTNLGTYIEEMEKKDETAKTLYAKWSKKQFTITYIVDDNDNGTTTRVYTIDGTPTQTIELEEAGAKLGQVWKGWSLTKGGRVAFAPKQKPTVSEVTNGNESVTLYAIYEDCSYTVVYDANGGTGTMQDDTCKFGSKQPLKACGFNKIGYRFVGWSETRKSDQEYENTFI